MCLHERAAHSRGRLEDERVQEGLHGEGGHEVIEADKGKLVEGAKGKYGEWWKEVGVVIIPGGS